MLAARPDESNGSPHGLAPLGIFVCRARGEVFLTDDDLANFERHRGVLALVVAGGLAGFFVRELDGSVQAIRSHEVFRWPMPRLSLFRAGRPSEPSCPRRLPAVGSRFTTGNA